MYHQAGLGVELTTIGTLMAKHTVIGDPDGGNAYASANPSFVGSIRDPFLAGTARFTLSVSGVTNLPAPSRRTKVEGGKRAMAKHHLIHISNYIKIC